MARNESAGGISLKTLAVASISSALAAYVVQSVWRPGTLVAAAAMPVLVALLSEAINRPTAQVSRAGAQFSRAGQQVSRAGRQVRERRSRRRPGDPSPEAAYTLHDDVRRRRRIRLAVLTGALGFILVGAAWTTAELVAGQSLFGGEQRTTYFGGDGSDEESADEDIATPEATPTPTEEEEPEATPTPPAEETPTPSVTPEPTVEGQATPAPQASPIPPAAPAPAR